MNGQTKNNQFELFPNKHHSNELSDSTLPEYFNDFLAAIEDRRFADYLEKLTRHSNGFYDLSKNSSNRDYIQRHHDLIAYLCANGKWSSEQYEPIFALDLNLLYLVDGIVAYIMKPNVIQVLDDMIYHDYDIHTIRSFLVRIFDLDLTKTVSYGYGCKLEKCHMVSVTTPEYGQFLDLLNMFYSHISREDLFRDSSIMYEVCNYYFLRAQQSAGMHPADFDPDMTKFFMSYVPFDAAINAFFLDSKPRAQSNVEDLGYFNLLGNSIKSSIDLPNQIHYAANSLGRAADSATLCGERISEMSNLFKAFTEAFMLRAGHIQDKIESTTIITLIEVFIDFISDLQDLKAVPLGRWITYVSRILRCFIPNCIALAIEFVNTYIVSTVTAVAQGSSEFLTTVVTALVGIIAIGSVPDMKQTNKMVEYMKTINVTVPFSKNIVAMIQNIIKVLPDCIKGWFSQFVPEHFFYVKLINEYQEVLNSIDDFLAMDIDTVYFSSELQKQIAKTYIASHSLVKDMAPFISDTSGQFSLLREQLRKFDKMYESVTSLQRCGITRACPFSLTIFGSSQIGKSTLSAAVSKFMFPNFLPDKVRYVIPADPDEFWNGYSALHPVTCEDDADQDAEYKGALRFFSMITNAPYQPPMASLDDVSIGKKGTPYHSKMHIRCTNVAYPNPTTKVLSKEAYWKRRHMLVEARVHQDYIIGDKVQYDPLFRHLVFFERSPINETSEPILIGDVMDFFDLLKSRYTRHMENEERILAVMNASGTDFIKDLEHCFSRDFFVDAITRDIPTAIAQGKLVDLLNSATTSVTNRMQSTYNIIKQYLDTHPKIARISKTIAVVGTISGIVLSAFAIYTSIFGRFNNDLELAGIMAGVSSAHALTVCEAIPSGDMRTARYRKFAKKTAHAEGTSDPSAEQLTHDVVRGRQAFVKMFDEPNKKSNSMCGIFIGGRYLLVPYHLFLNSQGDVYERNSRMSIQTECVVYDEMFVPEKVRRLKTRDGIDKDVAVYECSIRVKLFKDIRHHFINENDLANLNAWSEATLNKYRDGIAERELTNCTSIVNKQYLMWNSEECMTLYKGFQYDAVTVSGDCGSVLVLYNTRIRGKLLGIHVAGEKVKHHGYAELITSQMLEQFEPRLKPAPLPTLCDDLPGVTMAEGNYTLYGVVPRDKALYPISKTEIIPSVISGVNPIITKPMDLSRKNFGEAISKYFEQALPVNPGVIPLLVDDQLDTFKQMPRYNLGGVVSENIAINGSPSIPYCDGINMHTSPGLPYKLRNTGKGKHKYFTFDEHNRYVVSDPELRARIDDRIAKAKTGQMVESIWVDIPKDERRKPNKKTRMIVIPPMDYTIVFRMYCMDFIVNFLNNHLKFYSAVGMNPYSKEWTDMINFLKANSNFGGDGDFNVYDGKLMCEIMQACLFVMNAYYANIVKESNHEENALVREVLFEEMVHTRTQCTNVLYCTHGGNPSGGPFTTICNTMCDDMYFKMAWMMMAPPHLKSLKHYYEHVTIFVYGDDNIKSISGKVSEWYNEQTLAEFFKDHGIKYTSAAKDGTQTAIRNVEDLSFLKNHIRRDGLIYHATMEEDTLREMVNWIRQSDDDYAATVTNCNMSLMMWYHYGKERFNFERNRLIEALAEKSQKYGNIARLYSYDYLHECYTEERMPDFPAETAEQITAVAQGLESQTAGESNEQNIKEETNVSDAVTFVEQKPSVIINKDVILNDESYLMHGDWSLQRMLARPQRIGTYSFSTSQAIGTLLKEVVLPRVFEDLPYNISRIISSYTYIRYRPVFRIQLNGNKFTAGRLCAVIMPWCPSDVSGVTLPTNLCGITALEHVFLDASSNDVVTITAPWLCPHEYYNYAILDQSATTNRYVHTANSTYYNRSRTHTLLLFVFNKLSVGTGAASSINATIWMHLEDVKLAIPVVSAATSQGGTHSYVTNNMQGWSKIANATLPNNIKGDTYDLNADLKVSTLDKPNDTMTPLYVIRRAMGYFGHAKNIEVLNRLALYPGGTSTSTFSDFGTDYDEMSLSYLCGKWTYWYTGTIKTTDTTGTSLTYLPITPYIYPLESGAPSLSTRLPTTTWMVKDKKYNIPLLGYVSMPFNFWTGSLKYRFDFITNSFVTAKVACAIIYGTACPDTQTAGIEPTSSLSYVFEVNADNKSFEIEVPYVSDTPWKHVMNGQFVQGAVTGANVGNLWDDDVSYRCCTGQVALYVLNPLSTPSGLPTTYDFNVFVAGGKDFQLNFVSRANTCWYPVSQGNIDPNPGTSLSTLGGNFYHDNGCMSEMYTSIRELMKRYSHVFTNTYKVAGVGTTIAGLYSSTTFVPISQLIMPFFSSVGSNLNFASTIHNWYLALYRLCRGSIRVKIIVNTWTETSGPIRQQAVSVDFLPSYCPMTSDAQIRSLVTGANDESAGVTTTSGGYTTTTNTTHFAPRDFSDHASSFHEIEIPYVHWNRVRPIPSWGANGATALEMDTNPASRGVTYVNNTNDFGALAINFPRDGNDYYATTRFFIAMGDDFRAGGQMPTPMIHYGGATTSPYVTTSAILCPTYDNYN